MATSRPSSTAVNITLNVYSHVSPTMHSEAANQVAGLFLDPTPNGPSEP